MSETPSRSGTIAHHLAPIDLTERVESLDVLRGFAVMGILIMNIQSFAMVDPAYFNPTVYGDFTGINFGVWLFSHLFADMKFITIFSMLFGAGIVLMCRRVEQRGDSPAGVHYRRSFWLLLFGLAHAYLLWRGDVLVWYSFSAFIAYLFWRVRPGWLLFWALLLFSIGTGIYALAHWSLPHWPEEAVKNNVQYWQPSAELIAERLQAYRGSWVDQMSQRVPSSLMLQTFIYLIFGFWRIVGSILLGMALMKWGVFSAQRSSRYYYVAIVPGLLIGLPLIGFGASQNIAHDFSWEFSMYGGTLFNYWGSLLVALAYVSIIMLICKNKWLGGLRRALGATGRMAFSSYILQTLICTILFYGHGFGLIGQVPRWGQLAITVGVWIAVVVVSNLWLARFQFGPLEWLWRSLTYKKRQAMWIEAG